MKAVFGIESPGDIEATIQITMPIKKWVELNKQLSRDYPSWQLSVAINTVVTRANEVFTAKGTDALTRG